MYQSDNQQSSYNSLQIQSSFSINPNTSSQFANNLSPGSLPPFFNLSGSSYMDNIDINDIFNFSSTPKKRMYSNIQDGSSEYVSGKRQKSINIRTKNVPYNENYHRSLNIGFVNVNGRNIYSCFIGACRFKTYSCKIFERHLNMCHDDQRGVLRGFCIICERFDFEGSIAAEFIHLFNHVQRQFLPRTSQNNDQMPARPLSRSIHIKEELECDIMDETVFEDQNETIRSNIDINDVRNLSDIELEHIPMDQSQLIPMEPSKAPIKEEAVPVHDDLDSTIKICEDQHGVDEDNPFVPQKQNEESQFLIPIFKNPESSNTTTKSINLSLRKRAQSTYVERDSDQIENKRKSQTTEDIQQASELNEDMCLEFISKKIRDVKTKENVDKLNSFKPSESIIRALMNRNETSPKERFLRSRLSIESQEEKIKKKFIGLVEKRKETTSRRESLRIRKSDETKSDNKQSINETQTRRKSNEEKSSYKTKREDEQNHKKDKDELSNIAIDAILEKVMEANKPKDPKTRKSNECDRKVNEKSKSESQKSRRYQLESESKHKTEKLSNKSEKQEENDNESKQKTPKSECSKKLNSKTTSNETKSSESENFNKEVSREKTLTKSKIDSDRRKSSRTKTDNEITTRRKCPVEQEHPKYQTKSSKSVGSSESAILKGSSNSTKNQQTSINDNSSNSLERSLNSSINSVAAYTVDIDSLISKASSSLEFVAITQLYPWISENITSAIFKTKTSIDIQLNEFSLFSTYKCMNELCYYFSTEFEEFKKHARSHDSMNNYCSYCLKNFDKSNDLCNHIEVAHNFDRFQCNKCMYRSCQKGYVDVHQKVYHPNEENCEVFKSPVQKLLKSDRSKCLPTLQKNREKFIMPYRCKTPRCREVFFSKDNFRKHLEAESSKQNNKEFVTLICQQLYAIDHSKSTNNSEGIYQCLHCQYGTDENNIFDHMALNHPHEFAYVCKRVKPQRLIELNILSARETIENSTSIEYIVIATADAKKFEGNIDKLNSKNLEKDAKSIKDSTKCLVVGEVVTLDD